MFFYKNAVNVFSDASTKIINPGTNKNKFLTCPGFVTTINGSIINEGYDIVEATVNYAELYAIRMGISDLLKYKNTDLFLNIFSDSKISVFGLREWFFKYYKNGRDYTLMTNNARTGKKPVANQELILDIVRMILQANVNVSIYHVPGHIQANNIDSMNKFHYMFHNNNFPDNQRVTVPLDTEIEIAEFNNYVDNLTRTKLNRAIKSGSLDKFDIKRKLYPAIWYPKPEDVTDYLHLVHQVR